MGFALAEIVDLLDHSQLTEERLVELLQAREGDLLSEIGEAISDLLPRLREQLRDRGITNSDIVLTYDGAADANSTIVTVGTARIDDDSDPSDLALVEIDDTDRGVTVRFDAPPSDIGDVWINLDASLEAYDLETTGIYRQILTSQGGVILQAPAKEQSATC